MKVKTTIKAGIDDERPPPNGLNHGLKIKTTVKAGTLGDDRPPPNGANHGLKLRTRVKQPKTA